MAATREDGSPTFQKWEHRPPPIFGEKVAEHVAKTGQPETFPGLHPGPISTEAAFVILREISVPRGLRPDGTKAPCPMCTPNRFYEGKLVWLPEIEAAAVIGHCCGNSERRIEAEREYQAEQRLERARDRLLEELPRNAERARRARGAEPLASEAERIFQRFRGDGATYHKALRLASKDGPVLYVDEVVGRVGGDGPRGIRTAGSTYETRRIPFGELKGRAAVATRCDVAGPLRSAAAMLEAFSAASEDEALERVVAMTDEQQLSIDLQVEQAVRDLESALARLADFRSFFTKANFAVISRWGAHRDCPRPMRAALVEDPRLRRPLVEFTGAQRFAIVPEPIFWRT
jgi:hypothetical protein